MGTKKIRKMAAFILSVLLAAGMLFEGSMVSEAAKVANSKKVVVKVGKKSVQKKTYSLQKGKTAVLKIPASSRAGQKVKFRSNKKSIVSVNKKGRILAKKKGTAKITITLSGTKRKKRTTWVKVKVTSRTSANSKKGSTPITLTVGNTVLDGYLNNSKAAKSLLAKLPLTVTLEDSDNDFCGGNLSLDYDKKDVQYGYKNGDLAFWTPANNFVIFVDDEEKSADTGDLVILGKITSPKKMLSSLKGTIKVTIRKKESPKQTNIPETPVTPIPSVIPTPEPPAQETPTPEPSQPVEETPAPTPQLPDGTVTPLPDTTPEPSPVPDAELRVKISVGSHELTAKLEDNATTRALIEKLPITLPMLDLYGREMCYRFDDALPTDTLRSDGYEVGDIAYWPPRHSFVILYKQNGEQFSRQHLGHIDSGVEIFDGIGDTEVMIERLSEE